MTVEMNARAADWQRSLAAPVWLVWRVSDDLTVYGSIPDLAMLAAAEAHLGASPAEVASEAYRAGDARSRGWLWGRWFSSLMPDGEWGAVHCAEITRTLTQHEFDGYRARGWVDVKA